EELQHARRQCASSRRAERIGNPSDGARHVEPVADRRCQVGCPYSARLRHGGKRVAELRGAPSEGGHRVRAADNAEPNNGRGLGTSDRGLRQGISAHWEARGGCDKQGRVGGAMRCERRQRGTIAVAKSRIGVDMPWSTRLVVVACLVMTPFIARSQNVGPASDTAGEQLLNSQQLDALAAPIALYPDPLLAQVLMASTY